jgi:chloramphenicol 3-O-phosphotransferase
MAAAQFDVVHSFATYDVRVDMGVLTPEEAADVILRSACG